MPNEWSHPEYAAAYLAKLEEIPHRREGESTLLSEIPNQSKRVLDLGCGNGHLLSLVLERCPQATGVALDVSPPMLEQVRQRFADDSRVSVVEHDLEQPLPDLGSFDAVVSSFAIHHCADKRKRELYSEILSLLDPGGIFCNLEHVSSPHAKIHERFVRAMNIRPEDEDPSNKLLDVETQLHWLKDIGFQQVDCYWKWRELALLIGFASSPGELSDLEIDDAPRPDEVRWLDDQIEDFNKTTIGVDDFKPLNLVIRRDSRVIAGLKGLTGWGWLYVQVLWVKDDDRRNGLGSQLVLRAEEIARARGCIGVCLSTFTFQAPGFYERHGYTKFGNIDDYPLGETLFFMSKRL